jgi:proline iminopeptidase
MPESRPLFPAIEPYRSGYLSVSPIHNIYFEECGNPAGVPVVVLHGGPGSGCNAGQRRFFDPQHYRIVLFDQRGSGRSTPAGETEDNTTQLLVSDMEQLRTHLKITSWLVFGGSWGSTLALSYAAEHKAHIHGLILRGIFLARPADVNWFLQDTYHFFPEAWDRFTSILSEHDRMDILAAYTRMFREGNQQTQILAARTWSTFEAAIMTLLPPPSPPTASDEAMVARLKVHLHYLANHCFLLDSPLLSRIAQLRSIPTIIIHGRYDMVCPVVMAYELHQAWPEAEFRIIPDAGHAAVEPGIASALIEATEQFKLTPTTSHATQTRP